MKNVVAKAAVSASIAAVAYLLVCAALALLAVVVVSPNPKGFVSIFSATVGDTFGYGGLAVIVSVVLRVFGSQRSLDSGVSTHPSRMCEETEHRQMSMRGDAMRNNMDYDGRGFGMHDR